MLLVPVVCVEMMVDSVCIACCQYIKQDYHKDVC